MNYNLACLSRLYTEIGCRHAVHLSALVFLCIMLYFFLYGRTLNLELGTWKVGTWKVSDAIQRGQYALETDPAINYSLHPTIKVPFELAHSFTKAFDFINVWTQIVWLWVHKECGHKSFFWVQKREVSKMGTYFGTTQKRILGWREYVILWPTVIFNCSVESILSLYMGLVC